ncbi:hypothetical protein [Clostridium cylindrosporum]|uniref:Uncharacterized protein n=1 Tax=Clostridium cylindrosporum DSM 605 TaxID=1121307 RepID=A0A0J8DG07_CLOCY|nr:hypothetical protein [Clostridium cylindrosporum]KMT23169.1 hypothetical protein CLCY_6c00500 [Clostridium cylindrosporum DSM 605]
MTSHRELKVIGENCTYYSSNSLISALGVSTPTSCTTCSNWSGAKCLIGVYDSVKNLIKE